MQKVCFFTLISWLVLAVSIHGAPESNAPAINDLSGDFTNLVFADNFNEHADGEYPDGWQAMAILGHPFAEVDKGAFRILTGVNIHMIQPLVLDDFLLKYRVRGEKKQPEKLFCHMPCFHMSPDHTGYFIFHQFGRNSAFGAAVWKVKQGDPSFRCTLHDLAYDVGTSWNVANESPLANLPLEKWSELAKRDFYDTTDWHDMTVIARGERFYIFQDGLLMGMFNDQNKRYARGLLGFTTAGSSVPQPGAMYLDDVEVYAKEPAHEEVVTSLKNIEIPWKYNRLHGTPMQYDVEVTRYGKAFVLKGNVRGGACISANFPHVMLNPYVKLETVDGSHATKLYLYRGTVGHVNIDGRIPLPPFGPADTSGPQKGQCYLDYDPGKHRVSVGYEYYVINPGATLAGPCEVIVDAAGGKAVYEGIPMKDGVIVTMSSPKEKKVLQRVNRDNPLYNGFKEFLEDNHFFVEGEKVLFRADLLMAKKNPALSYQAEFHVKDAFKDRVLKETSSALEADASELGARRAAAGLNPHCTVWVDLCKLEPGVYHLEVTARDSDGVIKGSVIKAFSVLPEKVDLARTPAEQSGLPAIDGENVYVMQAAYQADPYHYASLAGSIDGNKLESAELQYALNKRAFLHNVDISTPEAVEKLKKYFPYAVGFWGAKLPDEYARPLGTARIYSGNFDFFIKDFVKSSFYKAMEGHGLEVEASKEKPDYEKLKKEVKQYYWKDFTACVAQRKGAASRGARAYLQKIAPNFLYAAYGFPYPCNIDYMSPYGGITSGGIDLKNQGWERDLVSLESYWDECHYAPERDWACQALMKMVQPAVQYIVDDEGYVSCMEDGNNGFGWPPYGMMKVGPGFFKKEVVMTVFSPIYYREKKCRWAWDNYWRMGCFQQAQIDELLAGFKLVNQCAPDKPVQTVAYVYAQEWISKHPEVLDPMMYPYNPADESLVFAYEEGCRAGVLNGFFVDVSDLENLDRSLVNTLVLPPLKYADEKARRAIRKWHAQGVNMVGFEDVSGLEDLFGVKRLENPVECAAVRVADNPLAKDLLYDVVEREVKHTGNLKTAAYGLAGGQAILECVDKEGKAAGPALVLNRGSKASALFWTLEPTDIARSRNHMGDRMRGECASELVRFATGRGMRLAADTPVTTTEGNLISFWGKDGKLYVMVCENAFPYPSRTIHPLVKVRMKGIGKYRIESGKKYTPGIKKTDEITFFFDLDEDEVALFVLSK